MVEKLFCSFQNRKTVMYTCLLLLHAHCYWNVEWIQFMCTKKYYVLIHYRRKPVYIQFHSCVKNMYVQLWKFLYRWITQALKLFVSLSGTNFEPFWINEWHKLWNFLCHWVMQGLKLFVSQSNARFETFFLYHWVMQGLKLFIIITDCEWVFVVATTML